MNPFEPFRSKLYSFVLKLSRDAESSKDIVQDAMIRAWKARHTLHDGANPLPWLMQLTYRVFLDSKKRFKRRVTLVDWPTDQLGKAMEYPDEQAETPDLEPEYVKPLLCRLSKDDLLLIDMLADGLDYRDIAQVLDIPEGTVKSRINRARLRAMAALETR